MVTAAVVWGMNTRQTPLFTPLSRTTSPYMLGDVDQLLRAFGFTLIVLNAWRNSAPIPEVATFLPWSPPGEQGRSASVPGTFGVIGGIPI